MLLTPVTCAPRAFAIWTANGPTFPDAPLTSTRVPGPMPSPPRRPWRARIAAWGMVAATSNGTPAGLAAQARSGAHAYSAKAP